MTSRVFDVSTELLTELRKHREASGWIDGITQDFDAFLLDGGLGPPTYLSSDGRIIWDDDIWNVKATMGQAFSSIVAGSRKTRIARLLDVLPQKPEDAITCLQCSGSGWFDAHGQLQDVHGVAFSVVCSTCAGLGWGSPSLDLSAICGNDAA